MTKANMMKEILVRQGHKTLLAKICGCSIQSVRFALRESLNTDLAYKIRKEAIKLGGVEIKTGRRL